MAVGCVTAPAPRYFTLDMHPAGQAKAPVNIRVERLRESESIARKDILIQKNPTRIEYYAVDRWAAGLGEMIAQKFAVEWGTDEDSRATYVMSGTVLEFGQVDTPQGAEAHARMALEIRPNGTSRYEEPAFRKTYDVRRPAAAPTPPAVVEALSRCVEAIAAELAADASAWPDQL